MSIADGFGKKTYSYSSKDFIKLPTLLYMNIDKNNIVHGNEGCKNPKLFKAETFNGSTYEEKGRLYFNSYWRVICGECFKEYKTLIGKFKVESEEVK